jgi:hypothetical protein
LQPRKKPATKRVRGRRNRVSGLVLDLLQLVLHVAPDLLVQRAQRLVEQ